MSARRLADHLGQDQGLARFSEHSIRLLKLQRLYEAAMPAALALQGRVANFRLGKVVIYAENGAVAAKIRQLTPRIADFFLKEGVQVSEILVKVQPDSDSRAALPRSPGAGIGPGTRQNLALLTESLPTDSPLRAALERFLAHARIKEQQ
ncbi:MAG: DUF721 domain-containing protein [Proteobacteria bacterium]|nr:DUF721 domain-containing protein [Pseudomonadota bacterium]HQR04359.1 DciA family protein [Rhodocyclaceae bacterium]